MHQLIIAKKLHDVRQAMEGNLPPRVANSKILLRTTYFTAGNQLGTKIEHAKPLQSQ